MDLAAARGWAARLRDAPWLSPLRSLSRDVTVAGAPDRRLFVVGHPDDPPWHLTAHLELLQRVGQLPVGRPVLASPDTVVDAARGDVVLSVSDTALPAELLDRIDHARGRGGSVFAVSGQADADLAQLAQQAVHIPAEQRLAAGGLVVVPFETVTHLLPVVASDRRERAARSRLLGWTGRGSGLKR